MPVAGSSDSRTIWELTGFEEASFEIAGGRIEGPWNRCHAKVLDRASRA